MREKSTNDSNNRFIVLLQNLSVDNNIPDRKSFLDDLNKSQSYFEFTSDSTISPKLTISLIKNEENAIYESESQSAFINTLYYQRNRDKLTLESKYFYGYIISICILEYLFKENTDSTLRILRDNNPQVINEYIWYTQIPTHAKDTLDANFTSEKLRVLRSALDKIIMLSNHKRNKLSEKIRFIADILNEYRKDFDFYTDLNQILIHCNQEKLDNIHQVMLSDKSRKLIDFFDMIFEVKMKDTLNLFEALVNPSINLSSHHSDEEIKYLINKKEEIYLKVHGKHSDEHLSITKKTEEKTEIKGGGEITKEARTISNKMPGVKPETAHPKDALNYEKYADAFGDLICHKDSVSDDSSLTLGICAEWGRGKSSFLGYIKDRIDINNKKFKPFLLRFCEHIIKFKFKSQILEEEKKEYVHCQVVDFNAWKYIKAEHIWTEFLSNVIDKSINDKCLLVRLFKKLKIKCYIFQNSNKFQFYLFLISAIVFLLGALLFIFKIDIFFKIYDLIYLEYAAYVLALTAISPLVNFLKKISKNILSKYDSINLITTKEIRQQVLNKIKLFSDAYKKYCDERVVVFIDDLDRCQPDKILEIFEAMKLFLNIPNFVFVFAMDTEVIQLAVGKHYDFMFKNKKDTYPEQKRIGRHYLEKIVQIPFQLPQPSPDDYINLKNQLFKGLFKEEDDATKTTESTGSDVSQDKLETGGNKKDTAEEKKFEEQRNDVNIDLDMEIEKEELKFLDDLFKDEFELSPRLMTRFRNTYVLAKHFYYLKEENNNTLPKTLAIWLAISTAYPFETKAIVEENKIYKWNNDWKFIRNIINKNKHYSTENEKLAITTSLLEKYISNPKEVEKILEYTEYFNMIQ